MRVPYAHQTREVLEHAYEPGWFLIWEPRCMKTYTCVMEIALWIKLGIQRILVVAPKSGCDVWMDKEELGSFDRQRVRVIDLSTDDEIAIRSAQLAALDNSMPTVIVVNRDVIFKERPKKKNSGEMLTGLQKALVKWNPEALILDEFHEYRTPSSRRSRAALALAKNARFRRGLSGTPDPTTYVDYYSPFKIVCPEVFGTRKSDFEERYCEMSRIFPNKVDHYKNVDELRAKIFSRATVIRQRDCFDVPEVLPDIFITVPFTKLARELYDELTKEYVAEFLGLDIDATHQLARLAILHQLAQGFVRNEGGEVEWVFDGKIKAALDYVDEMMRAGKRLVIFHKYRPEGERLYGELSKRYGVQAVTELNGHTPRSERSHKPFFDNAALQIFVAQEQTANLSISLKEADHVLWYSWGPDWDVNYQARQRIFAQRSEKPHGLSYTFLEVPKTADRFMYNTTARKQRDSEALLDSGFMKAARGA